MQKELLKTNCNTPEFKASYAQGVFAAKANDQGAMKYSFVMLFPKDMTDPKEVERWKEMQQCMENACINGWGPDKSRWPKKYRTPFRDGDEERDDDDHYKGMIFVSSNTDNQPEVVDRKGKDLGPKDFYSGCFARAQVNFKVYKTKGNVGVSCYVNAVIKMRDGDRIGGGVSASKAFAEFFDTDDNGPDLSVFE